jgi:hypothetical protein
MKAVAATELYVLRRSRAKKASGNEWQAVELQSENVAMWHGGKSGPQPQSSFAASKK